MTHALNIGVFPTAKELRETPTAASKRMSELKDFTTSFINKDLRKLITEAHAKDCEGSTSPHTAWFKYPHGIPLHNDRKLFLDMLKDTLEPLGYRVYEEEDGARNTTGTVIITWREEPKKTHLQHLR